ncbi:ATP-binding protein [Nocardioides dilutus]
MTTTGPVGDARADVELRLPADGAYVSVLRTTSAGLAARLDFTLDDIEDLRMAVGEACALVLRPAATGTDMTCRFYLDPGRLTVAVDVESSTATLPDPEGFAWQVLTTLAGDATASVADGRYQITLTMQSGARDVQD